MELVKYRWILGDATCTVAYLIKTCNTKYQNLEVSNVWKKSVNKYNYIIALIAALNDQRMKFEEFQNNYNENGNNKFKPNEKNPSSDPCGNNSKLIVPEWRVKFKGNTTTVYGKKFYWCKHHKAEVLF